MSELHVDYMTTRRGQLTTRRLCTTHTHTHTHTTAAPPDKTDKLTRHCWYNTTEWCTIQIFDSVIL